MVQPYNYTIQAPSAFEQLVSGLKLGASMQEMQAAAQQRQMQMEQLRAQQMQAQAQAQQQAQQQERMNQLLNMMRSGGASKNDIIELAGLSSGEAQKRGLWSMVENMDQNMVRSTIGRTLQITRALENESPVAMQMLDEAIEADPQNTALKRLKQIAEVDQKEAAVHARLSLNAMGPEGQKAFEGYQSAMPAAADPVAQREAVAKADKAVADAITAQAAATTAGEKSAADLRRAQAEAQRAEVQARVQAAEEKVAGGIELTPELRTAIGSTKLPADQRQALLDLASAKAPKTAVTIQGEAEAGAFGKSLVARFDKIREQADLSTSQLANLDVAQKVLDDGFKTGFGTEWKAAAASVLSSLGVQDATRFATNAQLFLAQSRSALLTKQLEQKGPQTENDAKRIDQTFASLGNTREANKFLIAHARAMALRNRELVTFWQKYRRENRTFDGAQEAYEEGPGAKSIFDYAPLKPFASVVPESVWSAAPMPAITPPAAQAAPVTPAPAPRGPRPSLNDIFR